MKKILTPITLLSLTPVLLILALLISSAPSTLGEGLPLLGAAVTAADESAAKRDASYRDGRKALDDGRWSDAAGHFDAVISRGGKDTDAALYWKAYAHHKASENGAALAALSQLDSQHTKSRWRDDGRALRVEIKGHGGEPEVDEEDELKLLALNSLMHMEGDRAVEMIERFLAGDRSAKLRDQALFVLSQNPTPRAREILVEAAHGNHGEDLHQSAIRFLGMAGATDELQSIYAGTSDLEVKKAVLTGYMLTGDSDSVLAVYKSENDSAMRQAAVHQLGVMGSHEMLRGLYRSEKDPEIRDKILQGLFIAQDADGLIEIYGSENDPGVRKQVVRNLGLTQQDKAREFLSGLYGKESNMEVKAEILQGFFLAGATSELIKIIGSETDEGLKKKAIQSLGLVQGDEARTALIKIYRGDASVEIKKSVLHALFLNQAGSELIEIARSEKNSELRRTAIRSIGLIQSDETIAFMMEILEEK